MDDAGREATVTEHPSPEDGVRTEALQRGLTAVAIAGVAMALATPRPASAQADRKPFTPQELDQLLASIALYPDTLLSQVMMAATYPLEVVEAARWSQANPGLKGDAAVAAVKDKSWDVSVKSLVAFPPVLAQMNEHLDWTQKLGDAMISQEQDVADSIQRLRARASESGNLQSTPQQTVAVQIQGSERIVAIESADPQVIYVPSYNPSWAYDPWPYPSAPPYYWPFGGALARGFMWGLGFAAAGAIFGGWNWGYGRGSSYVNVNVNRATNIDRNFDRTKIGEGNRWQHNVDHRKGVAYRDQATRDRFGQNRPGVDNRQQFRGQQDQRPAGPGGGNRPAQGAGAAGGGQRPGGSPPAQRPGGGQSAQRPAGGGGLGGVDRGQQVNRESQRGRAQQQRTQRSGGGGGRPSGGGGGGGGGGRPSGGGGRPAGGGGGGGGGRPSGGGGRR